MSRGTIKCCSRGCKTHITKPHEWNSWDLWCGDCHAKGRGTDKPESATQRRARLTRAFLKKCWADGRRKRAGHCV
jgi:hypothetical protein